MRRTGDGVSSVLYLDELLLRLGDELLVSLSGPKYFSRLYLAVEGLLQQRPRHLAAQHRGDVAVGLGVLLHLLEKDVPSLEQRRLARPSATDIPAKSTLIKPYKP